MMKKLALLLIVLCPLLLVAQQGKITESERKYMIAYFTSVKERLKSTLDRVSDSQWKKRRADGGWSPAETMEHIVIGTTAQLVQVQNVLNGNEVVTDRSNYDGLLLSMMTDRGKVFKTPLPPKSNGALSKNELFNQFLELEKKYLALANDTNLKLRNYHGRTPFNMQGDAYQLMVLIGGHIFRHTSQIIEVLNEV